MNNMSYYEKMLERISSDEYQKAAYDTDDSTVVIAGPGSGKTTILTLKIMKLLNGYVKEPHGLACLTFSTEASREFKERLQKLGYKKRNNVFLGTVHSFCVSEILGNFAELYNCGIPMPIKIVPDKIKKELFSQAKDKVGTNPYLTIEAMNKQRSLQIQGSSEVEVTQDEDAKNVAAEYEKLLYEAGYIDFETVIIVSTKLIQEHDYVRACLSAKYPWLVIDEYQDSYSPIIERFIKFFIAEHKSPQFVFFGDSWQTIYQSNNACGSIEHANLKIIKKNDKKII